MRLSFFKRLCVITILAYVVTCGFLVIQERSLIYYPFTGPSSPLEAGLADFTDEQAEVNGRLIRFWQGPPHKNTPVLLYYHGNGGGLFAFISPLRYLADHQFNVLALEYPGYPRGGPGNPTQAAIIADAIALYDHAKATYPDRPIVIWGYSLGSGVASQVAAQRKADAVVLEAPFTAVVDRAAEMFPWMPVKYLMRDRYLSREVIGSIGAPLLIIHGTSDLLVPISHGEALFELAREPKILKRYQGADHWDLMDHGAYADAVEFLGQGTH